MTLGNAVGKLLNIGEINSALFSELGILQAVLKDQNKRNIY